VSNRAVRRQQLKEPKGGRPSGRPSLPKSGSTKQPARPGGGGALAWRPRFLMDIISELRKVVWPTREDTFHLALVVVIVTIIFGAILGAIDIGFGWLIDRRS
jgi:preprotein translocase subunit SecE